MALFNLLNYIEEMLKCFAESIASKLAIPLHFFFSTLLKMPNRKFKDFPFDIRRNL